MSVSKEFADYCCDLLAGVGPCVAKRMFGGWGVSVDGMSIAWLLDLGSGEKLWLKSNDTLRAAFDAAGCEQFSYEAKGKTRQVNYFAPPDDAMESAPSMLPWGRLALQAALLAHSVKAAKVAKGAKAASGAKPPKMAAKKVSKKAPNKPTPGAVAKTAKVQRNKPPPRS